MTRSPVRVGVDTGGTFTDLVVVAGGRVRLIKVLSTPANPAEAVLHGLRQLLPPGTEFVLTYGSTVATNAVLERRGARVLLFTTAGFEDVIEIGRQTRPDLYALEPVRPEPLVRRGDRIGVEERVGFDGIVLTRLTRRCIASALARARNSRCTAIAVCFLHSYVHPHHERRLAATLRRAGLTCSVSSELCPMPREFERFSTAVINAYVTPVMGDHLRALQRGLKGRTFHVMQSNGGSIDARTAAREAVRTILSGPAGGVVGAVEMARAARFDRVITFDMGGTSTDVSLVDREPQRRTDYEVGGLPVNVPAIDVHTVGAGGGSIACCDPGGVMRVGPQSAGADPGPACYGKGRDPTVTDANLLLGRLGKGVLAGGMRLDRSRAEKAVGALARQLGLDTEATAIGIVRVANAAMERAIRRVSVERGHDPRKYTLVAFGGAAGLHACELADGLGIGHVLLPRNPGVLSAWGAATADVRRDYAKTLRRVRPPIDELRAALERLQARARRELGHGRGGRPLRLEAFLATRYVGQSYEIEVPFARLYEKSFHRMHQRLYGHQDGERPIEVVQVRLRAAIRQPRPRLLPPKRRSVPTARTAILIGRSRVSAPVVDRAALATVGALRGPAVIAEESATTYVAPGWRARMDRRGQLHLTHAR